MLIFSLWKFFIFSRDFWFELKISFKVLKFFSRDFARVGPIPGKPSKMNCFCCWMVRFDLVSLRVLLVFVFVWRFAI